MICVIARATQLSVFFTTVKCLPSINIIIIIIIIIVIIITNISKGKIREGGTPYSELYGEAPPKRGAFFSSHSAFNKHRQPMKSVSYFIQKSQLLFALNWSN